MPITTEAEGLALRLLASYPAVPASKMVVLALAESLDRMGLDIAEAVVDRARTEIVKIPSVAQLYEVAREIRVEAEAAETRQAALPSGEELAEWPPEVVAKVAAMREAHPDSEERIAEENAEWQRNRDKVLALPRMPGVCAGTGEQVVIRDGQRVCPSCGAEIPDIHVKAVPPSRRESTFRKGRDR